MKTILPILCLGILITSTVCARRLFPTIAVEAADVGVSDSDGNFISSPKNAENVFDELYDNTTSSFTNLTSGIDLSDNGTFDVSASTFINCGYAVNLNSQSTISIDTDTVKTDIDTLISHYDILIDSWAGPGVGYVTDATDASGAFEAAVNENPGKTIWANANLYIFKSTANFTADGVSLLTAGATIQASTSFSDLGTYSDNPMFGLSGATNFTIEGFLFNGNVGVNAGGIYIDGNSDFWTVRKCIFTLFAGGSDDAPFYAAAGADNGFMNLCTFKDNTNSDMLISFGDYCIYDGIQYPNNNWGMKFWGGL